MDGINERLARLEVMISEIREDLQHIRAFTVEIREEMRRNGERIARLEEGQRRQDEQIAHLRSRDWVGGIIAVIVSSILSFFSNLGMGGGSR